MSTEESELEVETRRATEMLCGKDEFAIADRKAERLVGNVERNADFIHQFWKAKKKILREQFAIHWKTPAELNPSIKYASYGQPEITDAEDRILRQPVAPRLSSSSEQVQLVDRSFDGIARAWTRDPRSRAMHLYLFEGHDAEWTFKEVSELEE